MSHIEVSTPKPEGENPAGVHITAPTIPARATPENKRPKRITRIEGEVHKAAFAFYYSLGQDRTLERVAQEFGVKRSAVVVWSSNFHWKKRIREMSNRRMEDEFREKAMSLLLKLLDSFSAKDETGKMILTAGEKSIVERLKLTIDAFKRLRDDDREQSDYEDEEGSAKGPGRKKTPPFMVNVIFKGI